MARFQTYASLLVLLLLLDEAKCCHPSSKELHICLNIYLERDFPIVETILKGQQSTDYRRGRVLLEGPDLQNICRHVRVLQECYAELIWECNTYWQLHRYQKLMKSMTATYNYLCENSTDNVRDILLNGACVRSAEEQFFGCSEIGISWTHTWKEILRLQVSPSEKCISLSEYKECFIREMANVYCGVEASKPYGQLIDLWLNNWCSSCCRTASVCLLVFLAAVIITAVNL